MPNGDGNSSRTTRSGSTRMSEQQNGNWQHEMQGSLEGNAGSTTSNSTHSARTAHSVIPTSPLPPDGMRRRSSILNGVNADNPMFTIPASRQKVPPPSQILPISTTSGTSLQAQAPLSTFDPRSPLPQHDLRKANKGHHKDSSSVALPIPFLQPTFLPIYDESDTASSNESQSPSVASSPGGTVEKDGLMSMSASDLRRESFHQTAAANSKRAAPISFLRSFFSLVTSRRMRRIAKMWTLALLALFLMTKSLDFLLPRLRASPQVRTFFDQPPTPPLTDLVKEQMRQVAESIPRPNPRRENVQKSSNQVSFEVRDEVEAEEGMVTRETVDKLRKDYLWRNTEEEHWVQYLNPVKGKLHESTVIYLHGLRQNTVDSFLPPALHPTFTSTRWVLPQANNRTTITLENDTVLWPSWFDLKLPYDPLSSNGQLPNLFASVRLLNKVIRYERSVLIHRRREFLAGQRWASEGAKIGLGYSSNHGPNMDGRGEKKEVFEESGEMDKFGTEEERKWASKRIVLAGFSQGSVVALLAALTGEYALGGVAVFSGFLPMRWELSKLMSDLGTKEVPIFWGHGSDDEYLTLKDAITSINLLRHQSLVGFYSPLKRLPTNFTLPQAPAPQTALGMQDVTFRVYPSIGHSWCQDEVGDVKKWLKKLIPTGSEK